MHHAPRCPLCTEGLRVCPSCDGSGLEQRHEDTLSLAGEHRTRATTHTCERCCGEGAVACRACGATGEHPAIDLVLAVGRALLARRRAAALVLRSSVPANGAVALRA